MASHTFLVLILFFIGIISLGTRGITYMHLCPLLLSIGNYYDSTSSLHTFWQIRKTYDTDIREYVSRVRLGRVSSEPQRAAG